MTNLYLLVHTFQARFQEKKKKLDSNTNIILEFIQSRRFPIGCYRFEDFDEGLDFALRNDDQRG